MSSNIKGSIIGFAGMILALFTHMIIKDLTKEVDFLITIFARFCFSLPLLFLFVYVARKKNFLQVNNWKNVLLRSFFGIITMTSVFLSLQLIPIGLVTALAQSSAIFVTLLAPFFLQEKIGIYRWTAVLIGLFGVYMMTNPLSLINGTSNLSPLGVSLATFSAISHAGLALTMRKLGQTEHPTTTAFIHNVITSILVIMLILLFGSKFVGIKGDHGIEIIFSLNKFLYTLLTLGIIGSFIQYFMATSYKYAEATILVTIRYLAIPLAVIFGYIIWKETLNINQIFGGVLILTSCVLITFREIKSKTTEI
mgnify:CR=1 FL=1